GWLRAQDLIGLALPDQVEVVGRGPEEIGGAVGAGLFDPGRDDYQHSGKALRPLLAAGPVAVDPGDRRGRARAGRRPPLGQGSLLGWSRTGPPRPREPPRH